MRRTEALFLIVVGVQLAVFFHQVSLTHVDDDIPKDQVQFDPNSQIQPSKQKDEVAAGQQANSVEATDPTTDEAMAADTPRKRLKPEEQRIRRLRRRQQELAQTEWANRTVNLLRANYYNLTEQLYPNFPLIPELMPLKIMRRYISDHSQQNLQQMWLACGNTTSNCEPLESSKWIVASYSCPLEAGNRLHKFMNGLVWAILTKRYFLWDYFDSETCRMEEEELATGTCDKFINSEQDCADILHLADWVPSWDEWSVKLNLPQPIRACGIGQRAHDVVAIPIDADDSPRVLRVGQQVNLETGVVLGNPNNNYRRRLLTKKTALMTALQLFKQGFYFTYGMFFEALFTFDKSVLPDDSLILNEEADTYAIHSRHPPARLDPNEIGLEVNCMKQMLVNRSLAKPCVVCIMTDREETLPLLSKVLTDDFNCRVIVANTTKGFNPFRDEHGSFAGKGFFQDLALIRHARSGMIAPHLALRSGIGIRSSSALAREMMEFRRILELQQGWDSKPDFKECYGRYMD